MSAEPENALEQALRLAAQAPAERPAFIRTLLESEVLVIGHGEQHLDGQVAAGDKLRLQHWQKPDGTAVLPFFTSLDVLAQSIEREEQYLSFNARALFEMTRGATLVLNPRSPYGKEFVPHEVEQILAHGSSHSAQRHVVQEPTQVLLGQPKDYPDALVAALQALLAKHANVQQAFLALMHDASRTPAQSLLVGLEVSGDAQSVLQDAGSVASDTAPQGMAVDLVLVGPEENSGLSQHFYSEVEPFYRKPKSLWARLRSQWA